MASSGTLPRANADRALADLLVAHGLAEAEIVADVRAALESEGSRMGLVAALLDAGVVPRETIELFVADLERGVLSCPGCGGRFNVGKLAAGTRFKCKTCGAAVAVPAARITRDLLAGGDIDLTADDLDLDELPMASSAVAAADDLSEDDLDAVLSGGTAEGQLLDFSAVDVTAEPVKTAPRPKRARSERPPRRSSRRASPGADPDDDAFDPEGLEEPKDPHFWQRLMIFVVIPIVVMILGIYYTPAIKRAMMGGGTGPRDEFEVAPSAGGSRRPTIAADKCTDWKNAEALAREALALVQKAQTELANGNKTAAIEHYDAADAKFQEAYDAYAEVESAYSGVLGDLPERVKVWVETQEQANDERAKAAQ